MKENKYLYAVRNVQTGKLESNLTNPKKKFWQIKRFARRAIVQSRHLDQLELVTFELVEVEKERV